MMRWGTYKKDGFTIVELLIVIVVIAILAAITIVAYNGIRERALTSSVQSALSQVSKKIQAYAIDNNEQYPATLSDIGVQNSGTIAYQYTSNNTVQPARYTLTASNGIEGSIAFYISSTQPKVTGGIAPGHNIMAWEEPNMSSAPFTQAGFGANSAIDTTEFRSSPASIRLNPGAVGKRFRIDPVSGAVGQTITVSLWVKTESNWNGATNNSKIRMGASSGGALIKACDYAGVKLTWTQITCSYTLTSTYNSMNISVGNDGTVGNIWIDDIHLSIE